MKVKELLASPSAWTTRTYARNEHGHPVTVTCTDACCFCLAGAVYHCYSSDLQQQQLALAKLESVIKRRTRLSYCVIESFNDNQETTHYRLQRGG